MTPLVSVVMAAKNYARFLPQAVESVRAQAFRDWELIVVDDGSSDATPEVVRPFLTDHRAPAGSAPSATAWENRADHSPNRGRAVFRTWATTSPPRARAAAATRRNSATCSARR